jgi:Holliday junction resolvase RusA-like endonuclease
MASLTVPLPLPQLNDVVRLAKLHPVAYSREKKRHTARVFWLARAAQLGREQGPVRVRFEWHPKDRRSDLDNLAAGGCKAVLDGLVAAGVLRGDSMRWVTAIAHELMAVDKEHPHVVVSWEAAA